MAVRRKAPEPFHPAQYEPADMYAVKAVWAGTANERQQRRALEWILNNVCSTYDLSFRPDSQRVTDFAEGKRFVGLQIVKAVKLDLSKLPDQQQPGEQ